MFNTASSCTLPKYLDLNRDGKINGFDWSMMVRYEDRYSLVLYQYMSHYNQPTTIDRLEFVKSEVHYLTKLIDRYYFNGGNPNENLDRFIHYALIKAFGKVQK